MNDKKDFNDLVFNAHANVENGIQARLDLGNDTTISVVSMKKKESEYGGLYGDASQGTYEVAVFHHGNMVPLSAWDDVIGWQTEDELTELMANLQGDAEGFSWKQAGYGLVIPSGLILEMYILT